ncbi:uncharacterized protein LOC133300669 [Gastrolobium bilobum]|uniref:uncharacterized protein LOC133300669 n=1 Tax=Gastrolobium bilobum TaxID=150636 RepID=UPI002AAFEDFC|nr:uncharacterized protein LOC133300669 [Gastrolobium bilobum]
MTVLVKLRKKLAPFFDAETPLKKEKKKGEKKFLLIFLFFLVMLAIFFLSSSRKLVSVNSFLVDSAPKRSKVDKVDPIDSLFEGYVNRSSGLIDPEGIEALCDDLYVDHTDVRILILAWKMEAKNLGFFSKDEWRRGLKGLGVDTIRKLRKELNGLEKEVIEPQWFEDFYFYAFKYNLMEDHQRTVDIDSACQLLNAVLRPAYPTQVNLLIEYLKIQSDYGALSKDHWTCLYYFFKEVNIQDLESYDSSQAWPLILDNFIEWLKEKEKNI